jgi:hypothetical protein
MGNRCTSCGPVVYDTKLVKFKGEPERFPMLWYPQCQSTDTIEEHDDRFTYYHCEKHRFKSPTNSTVATPKDTEQTTECFPGG